MSLSKVVNANSFLNDAPNIRINYLYRDSDNYKQHAQAIFKGLFSQEQAEQIVEKLESYDGFVPSSLGMDDLQTRMHNGINKDTDHPWHELTKISRSYGNPTHSITAEEFFKRVLVTNQDKAAEQWSIKHLL